MATSIEIENNARLDRLLMTNPDTEKEVRRLVASVLQAAEKEVESKAAQAMKNGDYRNTALSVRKSIYRRVLGGNINILSGGRGRGTKPPQVPQSNRGRLQRTTEILGYKDRSFILRWIDEGTNGRTIEHMNGHRLRITSTAERPGNRYYRFPGTLGARGKVTATHFFGPSAKAAIEKAADELVVLLEQMYNKAAK